MIPTDVAVRAAPTKTAVDSGSVLQIVGMFLFLLEDAFEDTPRRRILVADHRDHLCVRLDRNAFGHQVRADHRFQVRLEPDLEQQDDDADFREQPEDRCERIVGGRRDHLEQPRPEDDPGQELTHHRRLSHPLERLAGELADQEHHREDGEEARHVEVARRAEEERETRGERPPAGGRARGAASP